MEGDKLDKLIEYAKQLEELEPIVISPRDCEEVQDLSWTPFGYPPLPYTTNGAQ